MPTKTILFVADSRLYRAENQTVTELDSDYMENYKNTLTEIRRKNAWKTTGKGAVFMGMATNGAEDAAQLSAARITATVPLAGDKIAYAFNVDSNGGLYTKNPLDLTAPENYIIRKKNLMIFEMDYEPESGDIIASVSIDRMTRCLAMFNERTTQGDILTEGDVLDRNPCFSRTDSHVIYYDSAGFSMTEAGVPNGISNRSILKLNLQDGDINTVAEKPEYDLFRPRTGADGSLYYLSKPAKPAQDDKTSLTDILHMPGKVLRAVFGWLNFFTQRYSGESLKKNAPGPVRTREKSDEQIFVEGNLINVTKSLRENMAAGDKHPGIAPKSWQLIRQRPDGTEEIVIKGVLDYALDDDGTIIYSNGKHIVQRNTDGSEISVCEINLPASLQIYKPLPRS